ncbi:hypothetical protein HY950_04065 [Candidatus Gottesmanbacteria bacterium]|nr:hypothetical protein [Candidatus Gottesmanbacteria bacterium]
MKSRGRIITVVLLCVLLLAAAVILWPLTKSGFFVSDDGEWMIIRLSAFYQSFRDGQFPVRFLDRLNHGYGYPIANFLYPGFLYIGSFIHLVGFSFVDSVKLILAGSVMGSAIFVFFWLRSKFTTIASFMGSLSFLFAPYLVFDLYARGSVGEVLAFLAMAICLYSIDRPARWIFPFAVGLLLVSHNSLAFIFSIFLCFYLIVQKKRDYWIPGIAGFGMAAFFWIPALLERRFVLFDTEIIARSASYFIDNGKLLLINAVPFLAGVLIITNGTLRRKPMVVFFLIVFATGTLFSTSLSASVWNIRWVSVLVQFPYRFLSVAILAGSWLVARLVDRASAGMTVGLTLVFFVMWMIPFWQITRGIVRVEREEGYYTTNEATTTVADEYLPRWVSERPKSRAPKKLEFIEGKGVVSLQKVSTRRIEAAIEVTERGILRMNTIYYPGWGAELNGTPAHISYRNPMGLISIAVPKGVHRLIIEFRETPSRLLADVMSGISMIIAFSFVGAELKKRLQGGAR